MSWTECPQAEANAPADAPEGVELVLVPRTSDVGGFEVRRALPNRQRRMVGPFIFLDQMGPAEFGIGSGLDVRPHPHIGLATVTYLFEGELMHRDSLGSRQLIRPGAVNWMTAGQGIAHSERSPEDARRTGGSLSGIQAWVALPQDQEESEPDFSHHSDRALPLIEDNGLELRLLAGELHGKRSNVPVRSETLYADLRLAEKSSYAVEPTHEERALYLAFGRVRVDGQEHEPGRLLVLRPGVQLVVEALDEARFLLLGGEPMDGPRHIWWNFVSSSKERIEQAKQDWKDGRFAPVVEESESIPLPEIPGP